MGEWKRIKLSEVLKEKTERNKNNETDLVLSVTNSQGFVKQSDFFEGTVHSEDISNYKLVRKNEFAYNPSRINVGSIDILKEYDIGALSPMYVIFNVDETRLLPDYFKYYFQTHKFNENVKNNTQGSVRNSLSFKALSEFEYLLPPLEEQKRIVKILNQVNKVIEKYQNLINEKEQFIKSQFVEMFGNGDYKKVEIKTISEIRGRVGWKGYTKSDLRTTGPLVLGASHLTDDGLIDLSEPVFLSREKYEESPEIMIEQNDIIFAQRGSLGKVGLVKENIGEATINPCVLILRPNGINPEFLRFLLIMEYYNGSLERLNSGSTIPMISQKAIGEYKIILPSDDLQNKFERVVQLIDKQKFNYINKIKLLNEIINIFLGGKKI